MDNGEKVIKHLEMTQAVINRLGSSSFLLKGWQVVGREKSVWAEKITPHMNVDNNASPSFRYFREKVRGLAQGAP